MDDVLSWDAWLELDLGTPDWLIPGLLERGAGGLVHGSSRSFKSFLLLQLCLDLAAGYSILDIFPATAQHRTIMFQAEGTRRAWQARMTALKEVYPTGIPFWSRHTAVERFDAPAGDKRMRAVLALLKPDLVVIDPIAEFLQGSDRDDVAVQRWVAVANGWKADFGCAVVLVHHDRQPLRFPGQGGLTTLDAGMEEARGHTRLPAWADLVLGLRRKGDITTVRVQKVRDQEERADFSLRLVGGRLVLADSPDLLEQAVLRAVGVEAWLADVVRVASTSTAAGERTIRRAISRLVERGTIEQITAAGRFKLRLVKGA